jgi:hypothetical protein
MTRYRSAQGPSMIVRAATTVGFQQSRDLRDSEPRVLSNTCDATNGLGAFLQLGQQIKQIAMCRVGATQ